MATNLTLTLLAISLACAACSDHPGSTVAGSSAAAFTIPELPRRSVEFGDPAEYDRLLDAYDLALARLRKYPDDDNAKLRLAEVFITDARTTGHYTTGHETAITLLDQVIGGQAKPATKAQAYALKAVVELNRHNFQEALELGTLAVQLDPGNAFNHGILVDANTELGHYAEAVEQCDIMVTMRPDLRSYSRVSYQREVHGDIAGAIDAMGMAIKAGVPGTEETAWCLLELGGIHERKGDLESAAACYRESAAQRANYAYAMAALGRVLGKQQQYAQAEVQLQKATAIMGQAAFHEDLARVYRAQGKERPAQAAVDSARQALLGMAKGAEGHNHQIGLEMARFQFEFLDRPDLALRNAEHELEHRPGNIDVNLLLAEIHYAQGNMAKAETHAKAAASTGSTNPQLRCLQGLIARAKGDASGKTVMAQALQDNPYLAGRTAQFARNAL